MRRMPIRRRQRGLPCAPKGHSLRSTAALIAVLVVGLVLSTASHAAPGDLDPTFSGDGKQTTDFGFANSAAAAVVRQPDGKVIAVGDGTGVDGLGDFVLARYNPDGSLDTTFSGDGVQATDFERGDGAKAVALQANGKIVAAGIATDVDGAEHFAVARYNPNGSLDTTFSGDGKQTTDLGRLDFANGVAIQADGKIVAAGQGNGNFALARYNPNGSLDSTFSGDGKQTTDFGGGDAANGVAIQGDGKIVAVGYDGTTANRAFALARYNPNGSLDTTFSGDGKQTTDFGGIDRAAAVALQGNGRIVAVGGANADFALARYNLNGSLDTTFSGDGKQTTDFGGGGDIANAVAIQGDGKIVAAGQGTGNFALARYNLNGSLDPTFSGDGKQTTDFGGSDTANGVAVQADGKIIAVGSGGSLFENFALARYDPNGTLDPSFSEDGTQTNSFGGDDEATGVAVQPDGKIVAVGSIGASGFALARYNPDGSLDASFSGDGKQTTVFGGELFGEEANAVAIQPDGKIIVVGRAEILTGDHGSRLLFALARYNPNGTLDSGFSGDGRQTTAFGSPFVSAWANGVAIQGNGKIVVAGGMGGARDFALARYNPSGTLDTSFSGDGRQTTPFGGNEDEARGVAIQGDGKIVAAGQGIGNFALARYNANGSLDPTFSGDGKQATDFGGIDAAHAVAIQADEKIMAAGLGGDGASGNDFVLARYNPNGSLDLTFSGDGKQRTDFGFGARDGANGVAVQSSGKIVAAGFAGGGATGDDFALARYNPNGSLDLSFSGDGRRRTDFGTLDEATGLALQADGKIIAAGRGLGLASNDFALARYLGG
jgi:uncharacterized delta-60 repeat protein